MTDMIEVKTVSLEFGALDWCIAQVEGIKVELTPPNYGSGTSLVFITGTEPLYRPSTNWEDGGWLIGKHQVNLHSPQTRDDCWAAWVTLQGKDFCRGARQPLVAACRAIVYAKLGDTVQVPKELMP
ncbi:phage protein NinX family protein [Pseudomonas sp. Marseille-P9899]|uniref:phage protein NinX family protein n=1 Tax=Pseudomonas sp. Marseille-P9899 TaxID=2730401 RepID=UPI0015892760|nr:phage protein NinX family protein [Pseudomonas sp. Marseille-P9899]